MNCKNKSTNEGVGSRDGEADGGLEREMIMRC